ncbi:MAG: hypothetical protein R6V25_03560 [Desulfatiglandales bacterium]
MVINDFNIFSTGFRPSEADAPLPVYADAVLPGTITLEHFQPVTGRYSQILDVCGNFKLSQFPAGDFCDARKSLDAVSSRKGLGIGALEGSNHLRL